MNLLDFITLGALWISYFIIHSLLASDKVKRGINTNFPGFTHVYRVFYNISATIMLFPMFYFVYFVPSAQIVKWNGFFAVIANLLAVAALAGFIYSFKFYRGMDISGIAQYKNKTPEANVFVISPLHRFVRHPWYFFAIIIIWTRDMNAYFLLSASLMTAYFFIGSYFEEQKLKLHLGNRYAQYMTKVPGIIPSFKRYLTATQAENFIRKN